MAAPAAAAPPRTVDPFNPDFGPNVTIFSPDTPLGDIQSFVDALADQQRNDEMGTNRQAVLFLPGQYGTAATPLQFEVGYYTEVAGLGASPEDVDITGAIEVYNRCLADGGTSNCLALVNFWRTISNLSLDINKAGQDGCRTSANFWAVSQAVSMRRLDFTGGRTSRSWTTAPPDPSTRAAASSPTRACPSRSTDRSSSGSPATARSAAGATACGTRCSRASSAHPMTPPSRPRPTRRSRDAGQPREAVPLRRR